ncbi:MAG: peptidase domain-containing ABC transporter [Chitinophagaceae bacterium]
MNNPYKILAQHISSEKKEVYAIYVFAILNGLIQLSIPLGVQSIIGFVMGGAFSTSLVVLITLMLLGVLMSGVFQIQQMKVIEKIQQKLFHFYAFKFKWQIMRIDIRQSDGHYYPELMNRFLDVANLQKGLSKILLDIPLASIQILLGLLMVAIFHPLFLVMVFLLLTIIVVMFVLTGRKGLETSIKESSYKYEVVGWLEEIARMIHIFKLNRSQGLSYKILDSKIGSFLDYRTKHFNILVSQFRNLIFLKIIITAAMLILGTYLLITQQLNIGQFVAAEIIIITMINSVEKIIINLDSYYDVLTALDKLNTLDREAEERDGETQFPQPNKGIKIEWHHVSFAYSQSAPVFDHVNLQLPAGAKIIVHGAEGSGKTTFLRLLSTGLQPSSGSIIFNDIPVNTLQNDSYRKHIGFMLNRPDIFSGSILDNITMGNQEVSLQKIIHMAQAIELDDFVNMTEHGYHTHLDPVGKRIPQTVIKKILFIRAIVQQQALILLEEPFLEMNKPVRKAMVDLLIHEVPDSTVIIVSDEPLLNGWCTHRLHIGQLRINQENR